MCILSYNFVVASALSNKNSELSDVTKPLSSKERSGNSKSQAKEQNSAPADPLDGIDLNNYAGKLFHVILHLFMRIQFLFPFNKREERQRNVIDHF